MAGVNGAAEACVGSRELAKRHPLQPVSAFVRVVGAIFVAVVTSTLCADIVDDVSELPSKQAGVASNACIIVSVQIGELDDVVVSWPVAQFMIEASR